MKSINATTLAALFSGLLTGASLNAEDSAAQNYHPTAPKSEIPQNPPAQNLQISDQIDAANEITPKILNIGDSRTVGMYFSENIEKYNNTVDKQDANGNMWFAKVGQGFSWFENNLQKIQTRAQDCNIIVINLGVNDLAVSGSKAAADKYVQCLNNLAKTWKEQGKSIFFSSSNPVGPQYRGARVFNQKIDNFNQEMKNGLSADITFIDTNSYIKDKLKAKDFDSAGLHYVPAINRTIHQYIESQIFQELAKTNSNGNFNMISLLQGQKSNNL